MSTPPARVGEAPRGAFSGVASPSRPFAGSAACTVVQQQAGSVPPIRLDLSILSLSSASELGWTACVPSCRFPLNRGHPLYQWWLSDHRRLGCHRRRGSWGLKPALRTKKEHTHQITCKVKSPRWLPVARRASKEDRPCPHSRQGQHCTRKPLLSYVIASRRLLPPPRSPLPSTPTVTPERRTMQQKKTRDATP